MKVIVIPLVVITTLAQITLLERFDFIKTTGKEIKFLVVQCVVCNRKKSMIVSDNVIQAEDLCDFFKNLGKKGLNVPFSMPCIKDGKKRSIQPRTSLRFNSKNCYSSSFSKFQTGSINITRVDNILQHLKGSLPR